MASSGHFRCGSTCRWVSSSSASSTTTRRTPTRSPLLLSASSSPCLRSTHSSPPCALSSGAVRTSKTWWRRSTATRAVPRLHPTLPAAIPYVRDNPVAKNVIYALLLVPSTRSSPLRHLHHLARLRLQGGSSIPRLGWRLLCLLRAGAGGGRRLARPACLHGLLDRHRASLVLPALVH